MIAFALLLSATPPSLYWGYFEAPLWPQDGFPLGGYTARQSAATESGGDQLKVRVLALTQKDRKVAIVNLEALTVPESLVAAVQASVGPSITLFMGATHTHCAPDSQALNARMNFDVPGIAKFKKDRLNTVAATISKAIREAFGQKPRPFELITSHTRTPWARARRRLARPENVLSHLDFGGKGLYVFGAHATFYGDDERRWRGDWPGVMMNLTGGLVFPGAIGDTSPVPTLDSPAQNCQAMAEALVQASKHTVRQEQGPVRLGTAQTPINLGSPEPHPDFAQEFKVNNALAKLAVNAFAPKEASITGIRLGDTVILGIPGEPSAELGVAIRLLGTQAGFDWVAVVSHVNGWAGYMLSEADYKRGGYEANLNFYGPKFSSRLLDACKKNLAELAKQPRFLYSSRLESSYALLK